MQAIPPSLSESAPAYRHEVLAVLLRVHQCRLHVMAWQRAAEPDLGRWALPGGLLAVHVTNRYLDLAPVLGNLAADRGLVGRVGYGAGDAPGGLFSSKWAVLARDDEALAPLHDWQPLPTDPAVGVWTDDYSSPLAVVRW